jgi:hypothetical protein
VLPSKFCPTCKKCLVTGWVGGPEKNQLTIYPADTYSHLLLRRRGEVFASLHDTSSEHVKMSVNGIGGTGFNGYAYQPSTGSPDPTNGAGFANALSTTASGSSGAAASLPGGNALSGVNAFETLNGLDVTGAVTATMPDGVTFGIYSFVPNSEAESTAPISAADGSSASSSTSASDSPNFTAMEAALEQMVEQFMSSGYGSTSTSSTAAAAQSAYQQSASNSSTQNGATGTVA